MIPNHSPGETRTPALRALLLVVALVALANVVILVPAPSLATFVAGFAVTCLVPGYLLTWVLLPERDGVDGLERALLGVGLGYGVMILGGLALHYVPGPLTRGLILAAFDVASLVLVALVARRSEGIGLPRVQRSVVLQALAVLVLGAALRLPNLGYAEFQGDEATIALKSAAALQGRDDVLFLHKKGPAEILMPTLVYGLAGHLDETTARLPSALVTLAGLVALYQLGRAMFTARIGLLAALILACNGFFVGFGRIVQYQGAVFFMTVLALLAAYRWHQDRSPPSRFLFLAGLFTAIGLLAHYDAVFALPPIAYLAWRRWRARPDVLRPDARAILFTSIVCGAILACFFVPMVRHPYFRETTWKYLFELRLAGESEGSLHNTLPNAFVLSTYYSATYYMALLAFGLIAGVTLQLSRAFGRRRGGLLGLTIAVASATLIAAPALWSVGANDLAVLVPLAVTALMLLLRGPSTEWKTQWIWFAVPLILYTTVVESPRTHFHVVFAAWSVLVAVALAELYALPWSPGARRLAVAGFAGLMAISAVYAYLMFVQHDPEYRRTIASADAIHEGSPVSSEPRHPPGFWRPNLELPANGWFGFPYRAGWKGIGQLYADRNLQGTYWSNEEENVTDWYTRGAPRCDDDPRYYVIAQDVQDVRPMPSMEELRESGYGATYAIVPDPWRDASSRLAVYERDRPWNSEEMLEPSQQPLGDLAARFDETTSNPWFEPGLPYFAELGFLPQYVGARFGDKANLEGYALDVGPPGEELVLTLYWRGWAEMDKDYSVFVHLVDGDDESVVYAQSDGAPGVCGDIVPTTTWVPGRIYLDRRVLKLPDDMRAGAHELLVGMYDYETLLRLPVTNRSGTLEDLVRIDDVAVTDRPARKVVPTP